MSICTMTSLPGARAGPVAAAAPFAAPVPVGTLGTATFGAAAAGAEGVFVETSSGGGFTNPGSRIKALSPRPKAFRAIRYDLLGELEITLSPLTMYVVKHYWLTMARRLCQSYVPRNYGLVDLRPKEASKVSCHLLRERGSIVVHREQDALDSQRRVDGAPQSHERIEQL